MRKGQLTLRALEVLTELLMFPVEMATGLFLLSERPSIGRAIYLTDQRLSDRDSRKITFANLRQVNDVLYRLRKDGLITGKGDLLPILTSKGKKLMRELKDLIGSLPQPSSYKREKGKELTLVIFDIPEKQKFKRVWLREVLRYLDYKMIQKSVWLGNNKFPAEAVVDLEDLSLSLFVHVFSVNRTGTLTGLLKDF